MTYTPQELLILQQAKEILSRDLFTVTYEWVFANRTKRGGWKAAQLAALGLTWPPIKGWQMRVEGRKITQESRVKFESFGRGPTITVSSHFPASSSYDGEVPPWEDR